MAANESKEGHTMCERNEEDERWNVAVDWLLNSRHCADPDIQNPFWAFVEGDITEAQLRAS